MNRKEVQDVGLFFFGKMSASISHELKNVLAIINENAGLAEDLIAMAEKGRPLDVSRIKSLASKVKDQVKRGDEIVKTMNKFAHSADMPKASIIPTEFLDLVAALSRRLAAIKGFELEVFCDKGLREVVTNPFFLENLLWSFIEHAIADTGEEKKLTLFAEESDGKLRLGLRRSRFQPGSLGKAFPGERELDLAEVIGGEIGIDPEKGELFFLLSKASE